MGGPMVIAVEIGDVLAHVDLEGDSASPDGVTMILGQCGDVALKAWMACRLAEGWGSVDDHHHSDEHPPGGVSAHGSTAAGDSANEIPLDDTTGGGA